MYDIDEVLNLTYPCCLNYLYRLHKQLYKKHDIEIYAIEQEKILKSCKVSTTDKISPVICYKYHRDENVAKHNPSTIHAIKSFTNISLNKPFILKTTRGTNITHFEKCQQSLLRTTTTATASKMQISERCEGSSEVFDDAKLSKSEHNNICLYLKYTSPLKAKSILWKNMRFLQLILVSLLYLSRLLGSNALVTSEDIVFNENGENIVYNSSSTRNGLKLGENSADVSSRGLIGMPSTFAALSGSSSSVGTGISGYLDKLDNLERSVAAVLIKVAYGTTSTTKRSIPDNSYVPSFTTIATPLLTTLRYLDKTPHQTQQLNMHHRNYELDLERDHALPTSAPNADILKSNSNPTYPNPNRHHNHDRERHRHVLNSTPLPSLPNIIKKNNGQPPTLPMYPGDIPSYSPPARSFFTPPLPPEYQNPFADKPTLRGTNNEGSIIANTGTYINRRPIPPPSLMPGHERIPFRPPDLAASTGGDGGTAMVSIGVNFSPVTAAINASSEFERKKALNTPSRSNVGVQLPNGVDKSNKHFYEDEKSNQQQETISIQNTADGSTNVATTSRKEVYPSIRRILSGSNGNKGEIPEVLLKQVTSRPVTTSYNQPPSSPVVLVDGNTPQDDVPGDNHNGSASSSPNINKRKNLQNNEKEEEDTVALDITPSNNGENSGSTEFKNYPKPKISTKSNVEHSNSISSTPPDVAVIGEVAAASATSTSSTTSATDGNNRTPLLSSSSQPSSSSSSSPTVHANSTWTIAWNIHVYLSVVLFTILAVYSFYKMLTYNKLTHLFSQSYFVCIHLILIIICTARIFYLCYDAYNIHSTFHIFVSEILLNLPATFLTISFAVLILYLFLKSLNHKNNRYSALIRPLTVIVGCGVHVVLCITLHYVESYTMQNQQHHYQQQQQQQLLYRRQQNLQQLQQLHSQNQHQYTQANLLLPQTAGNIGSAALLHHSSTASIATSTPPRVLSLICQIIYIFICLSLGLLYLYLYRILKRILQSKSQNYIHCYQNLSYAIHITIATALLFVLLAALQIFGAISISTTPRSPLIATQFTAEIDWLQWGYQFSLRLIEIAIITLISWVASLKTSGGASNSEPRIGGVGVSDVGASGVFGSGTGREKKQGAHPHHHHHHHTTNVVAGFFLPCTSSSSQEQFDTDYPAVCNANTNLHTYTMRTGKLIYDDSFALNSLSGQQPSSHTVGVIAPVGRNNAEFQLQQPTYQRPYDTGSLQSSKPEYSTQQQCTTLSVANNHQYHHHHHHNNMVQHQYSADYLTDDATTDHYENPNFDLVRGRSGGSSIAGNNTTNNSAMQKFAVAKTSTTSSNTASSSGGSGSSAASQQQMLLLQSDSCYSEPQTTISNYDFNQLERPKFGGGDCLTENHHNQQQTVMMECWSSSEQPLSRLSTSVDKHETGFKKTLSGLERASYEHPERRSSNSNQSCSSSTGGCYASCNSFERGGGHYNGIGGQVRKSGTLNNIVSGSSLLQGRTSLSAASPQYTAGIQTLGSASDRYYLQHGHSQRSGGRGIELRGTVLAGNENGGRDHDLIIKRSSLDRRSNSSRVHSQHHKLQQNLNSDDDVMLSGSNVECTNLINNDDGSCIVNSKSTNMTFASRNITGISSSNLTNSDSRIFTNTSNNITSPHSSTTLMPQINNKLMPQLTVLHNHTNHNSSGIDSTTESSNSNSGTPSSSASESATSGSLLVAEHGFVRFRALDDINNAQGVGIHNASIRNKSSRNNSAGGENVANPCASTALPTIG